MQRFFLAASAVLILAGCSRSPDGGDEISASDAEVWRQIDADFPDPPAEFRLIQFSGHDGELLPADKMAAAGIGGVELFMQRDGYLESDEAWDNVRKNIEAANQAGLRVWMADDNGYPSGTAGGRVVASDPAFEARCLVRVTRDGNGAGPFDISLPDGADKFVHAFLYPLVDGQPALDRGQPVAVRDDLVAGEGVEGPWRVWAFALQNATVGSQQSKTAVQFKHTAGYPNLLDPAAMETFVSLTHEEYARRFGPLPGRIEAFVTNEPNIFSSWYTHRPPQRPGGTVFLPWSAELPGIFRERHGYDLLPLLPAIYEGGDDASARLVRRHFYETVGAALAENYSKRIAAAAEQSGTLAAGHPLLEENMLHHVILYGDFFRFVEPMDIPSYDVPMPDLRDPQGGMFKPWNYWFPKFLSSIAQAGNRPVVAGLLDCIISRFKPVLKPTPEEFRRVCSMAMLCGVNQFQTYIRWEQYDPKVYRGMMDYIARLAVVLRGARTAATVGVYYPIETYQAGFRPTASYLMSTGPNFHDLSGWPADWQEQMVKVRRQDAMARSLLDRGIDFDWLHGDWVREARIEDGHLLAAGGRYSTVLMPQVELLPLDVAEKLRAFEAAGGKVIWVNSLPETGDAPDEHEKVRGMFAGRPTVAAEEVADALGSIQPPGFRLRVTGPAEDIFTARFTRAGRRITFVFNNGSAPASPRLEADGGGGLNVTVYDPLDGSIKPLPVPDAAVIKPYASLLFVEGPVN
jgi:hypothetical protein